MFNGIQIRAFGRPVISKCNVIHPEEIHSVPSCMVCGIIMLKKSDIGIILKRLDNMPPKNFISVALGLQIPYDNNEISAKAVCNARPDQDRTPTPKAILLKYATVGSLFLLWYIRTPPSPRGMISFDSSEKKNPFHCYLSQH